MSSTNISRRGFISTVTISSAAATLNPLGSLAAAAPIHLSPSRTIKVVSTDNFSPAEQKRIRAISPNLQLTILNDSNQSALDEAEVILGGINSKMLQRAKKLKWVQVFGAGVEWMDKDVIEHPVIITNMQRIFAPVIAETAIGMMLSLTRGIAHFAIPNFNERKWNSNPPEGLVLDDLYNKTIGIVGMGGIGSETARRLYYGFNMKVIATDAKPMAKPEFVDELRDPGGFLEMVPKVDILMSAAPLTTKTKEMFNEEAFSRMKRTAYFINVSRGGLVKNSGLIDALKNKKIRGAGLDVVTPEPLPASDPLWDCPNLIITSHNSGHADIRFERMMNLVAENLRRYAIGESLMNVVDKKLGY